QAIRASLLASAIASTLRCSRFLAASIQVEPVALPALWPDQHHPCRLHKQNPQVAVTPLRYLAEDGAVPGRYLLGDKAKPGGEVAAFGEHIACADRRYHRAGDDRPNARNTHQPLTTGVSA